MKHEERKHAELAPSSAHRWLECNGSLVLAKDPSIVIKTSEAAKEGTEFHEWMEKVVQTPATYKEMPPSEMKDYVRLGYSFIQQAVNGFSKNHTNVILYNEQQVAYSEDLYGTLDFSMVGENADGQLEAVIIDYKYGKGTIVTAEDNSQLLCYALGLEKYVGQQFNKVFAFIFQPRTPGEVYNKVVWDADYLAEKRKLVEEGQATALKVLSGEVEPTYKAGKHCKYCPAVAICPTYMQKAEEVLDEKLDMLGDVAASEVKVIIPEKGIDRLAKIYALSDSIKHFLDEVGKYLKAQAEAGIPIPGLKLVAGKRNRKWVDNDELVTDHLQSLGINPFKNSLIGIGEAEKQLKAIDKTKSKEDIKEILSSVITLPEATTKLVPVDNDAPAIVNEDALNLL